jgi:hypothetical protein
MTMKLPIYMDYHATTPVDPRVVEAMLPYFTQQFGNAASRNHAFGWEAEEAVENARKQVADLIGASAKEVIFTSGATESNNLAIKGVAEMYREKGNHIITCVIEHKAVIDTCKKLEKQGARVTYLPVQKDGRISLDELRDAITDKTILITIMTANNEIGVLQPIAEIGAIAKEKGILFHTDAVQAVGKVPVNVNDLKVGHTRALLLELLSRVDDGLVLCHARDDVVALLAVHLRGALDGQVVRLGRAAREDDLLGARPDDVGNLLARVLDRFLGLPAERVVPASRVAEVLAEKGQHRLHHPRVHRGRGVIVHIDRQLHVRPCRGPRPALPVIALRRTTASSAAGDSLSEDISARLTVSSAARIFSRICHSGARTLHLLYCSQSCFSVEQAVTVNGPSIA